MARHRRAASVQAEAANKKIVEQALAAEANRAAEEAARAALRVSMSPKPMNEGSSPLSSPGSRTPTPGSSSVTLGKSAKSREQQQKEAMGKPTLVEQVQMAKALGIAPEGDLMGLMKKNAKGQTTSMPKNTPKKANGAPGPQSSKPKIILKTATGGAGPLASTPKIIPKKPNGGVGAQASKPTGGPSLKGQPASIPTQANTPQNKPITTPPNKEENKSNGGSTTKTPVNNNGPIAQQTPAVGNGNTQKRLSSKYLEDVPENQEQEREHKRPAQRQWVTPGHIRCPLNQMRTTTLFQEELQNIYKDSEMIKLAGPEYDLDPEQIGLSENALEDSDKSDESVVQVEPLLRTISGFDGLPQFGRTPSEDEPCMILSNSFSIHQQHFKHLDEQSKAGIELDENQTEELRLRTTFMNLMVNQKKDLLKINTKPLPIKPVNQYFELTERDCLRLALFKLKPARNRKADPPLFAEGTWHSSRRMEDEDATVCSFCTFECDFGVADPRVWLPVEASGVFCAECHEETVTSVREWQTTYDVDFDVQEAFQKNKERLQDLQGTAATPPLKELADTGYFKFQSLEQREVRTKPVNEIRHVKSDKLEGIEFAQRSGEQVMNAFNGAGCKTSSIVPQATYRPQPISPSMVLATFSGDAKKRFNTWLLSMAVPQKDQFLNYLRTLDNKRQWELISSCSTPGFAGQSPPTIEDIANRQAMVSLVEALNPDQQRFFMQNLSQKARSHMSPPLAGKPSGPSQTIKTEIAGQKYQRRLSNGGNPLTLQPSSHTTPTATGLPNAQQVGIAAHGHHRRPSYTGLPAPSPQTRVNFGGGVKGQNNLHGPSGDPAFTPMANRAMPGNHSQHRRTSSGSYPAATAMPNSNPNSSFPPNGWHINGPGGSPPMHSSSFSQGSPAGYYQQMPQSPVMGAYDLGPSNSYHGPVINGSGGSPPMHPFMPSGQQISNLQVRKNGTNASGPNMVTRTNLSPNQADNGVARNLVALQDPPKETGNASTNPFIPNRSTQSQPSNNGNYPAPLQTPDNTKSVQVIKLTRSGGIIGPTTFPKAPVNPHSVHRQNSHGQPVTGSTANPASRPANHPQMPKNSNVRPPSSSIPQTSAPLVGLGISNGQTMMGVATNNGYTANPGALLYPQHAHIRGPQSSAASPTPNMPPLGHFNTSTTYPSHSSTHNSQSHTHSNPPVLRHAHTAPVNASSMAQLPHPEQRQTMSQPATPSLQFQQLLFCRGCPWRQIDITKARICGTCKTEKLQIIKHRHTVFVPLYRGLAFEEGEGIGHSQLANTQKRTCMVCTGLATSKCIDCPLRICTSCQGLLTTPCKFPDLINGGKTPLNDGEAGRGKIWSLIEFLAKNRVHMRNDVCCFLPAAPIADS